MATQTSLFDDPQSPTPAMPQGFRYEEDIITEAEETSLVAFLSTLELKPFEFHGHLGNRLVTAFGLRYDYAKRTVEPAEALPPFLAELRKKVASFAGRPTEDFRQSGVNQYPPGAGISSLRALIRSNQCQRIQIVLIPAPIAPATTTPSRLQVTLLRSSADPGILRNKGMLISTLVILEIKTPFTPVRGGSSPWWIRVAADAIDEPLDSNPPAALTK